MAEFDVIAEHVDVKQLKNVPGGRREKHELGSAPCDSCGFKTRTEQFVAITRASTLFPVIGGELLGLELCADVGELLLDTCSLSFLVRAITNVLEIMSWASGLTCSHVAKNR